jgi:high-affinity nickel-transport protein
VVVAGGAIVFFGLVVPERLGLGLEFCVALMLILLGIWNLARCVSRTRCAVRAGSPPGHSHAHSHGDYVHAHPHGHGRGEHGHDEGRTPAGWLDVHFEKSALYAALRPVLIGVVHGLAGSAAVALLVLPIIKQPVLAMAYLLLFGAGTIAGMLLITGTIALPLVCGVGRSERARRWLGVATGALSFGFGAFLVYQIGFVEGFLSR